MSGEITLDFERLPAAARYYVRAVTGTGSGLSADQTIPAIQARIQSLGICAKSLARYRQVCGFSRSQQVPATYPHVLAFPLQLAVMTEPQFPLRLLGLIHVRNRITQHRSIGADETIGLTVSVDGHRTVSKGIEFDLVTVANDADGNSIWQETSAMLYKQSNPAGGPCSVDSDNQQAPHEIDNFTPDAQVTWRVPANTGRRYAAVAGDYNPIHLSSWTARMFGFRRAIATGMWTKARAAAAVQPRLRSDAYDLEVAFRKPIFLPGTVAFKHASDARGVDFAISAPQGDIQHLIGSVRYR